MDPDFDEAEIYVKNFVTNRVDLLIKEVNLVIEKRTPQLKMIVTGGSALEKYFPSSPEIKTHDFDLKIVTPKYVEYNTSVLLNIRYVAKTSAEIFEDRLNAFVFPNFETFRQDLIRKFNVNLKITEGKIFRMQSISQSLYTVFIELTDLDQSVVRIGPVIDVFAVNPSIIKHYYTFTGLQGSDPILSENSGKYYIPLNIVNGIPYAGLGYMIWDTLRMIQYTKERGLPKQERYQKKMNEIIQGLNRPEMKLSCETMKNYITKCETEFASNCVIDNKTFQNKLEIVNYAVMEGMIPNDKNYIQKLVNGFDSTYLCNTFKKIK